jgi:hypothetical protein
MSHPEARSEQWVRDRAVLDFHQHVGKQIGGACACGFISETVSSWLDHLATELQ